MALRTATTNVSICRNGGMPTIPPDPSAPPSASSSRRESAVSDRSTPRPEDVREDYHEVVSCLSWFRESDDYKAREDHVARMLKVQWRRDLAEAREMVRGARYKWPMKRNGWPRYVSGPRRRRRVIGERIIIH